MRARLCAAEENFHKSAHAYERFSFCMRAAMRDNLERMHHHRPGAPGMSSSRRIWSSLPAGRRLATVGQTTSDGSPESRAAPWRDTPRGT
eukprot:703536-Pleurochrysis_carterae.AAC.1